MKTFRMRLVLSFFCPPALRASGAWEHKHTTPNRSVGGRVSMCGCLSTRVCVFVCVSMA